MHGTGNLQLDHTVMRVHPPEAGVHYTEWCINVRYRCQTHIVQRASMVSMPIDTCMAVYSFNDENRH